LDTTNILGDMKCVICTLFINIDHMEFLSNSLHNIANEKIIIIILGRFVIFAGGYDNFKRLFIGR